MLGNPFSPSDGLRHQTQHDQLEQPRSHPGLGDLDDDVLSVISQHLVFRSSSISDLLSLSVLSKSMRESILPQIFSDVRWPSGDKMDFYPQPLWPYMRYVLLDQLGIIQLIPHRRVTFLQVQWPSRHTKALNNLAAALPHLTNIVTFDYSAQAFSPTLGFISSLAVCSASLSTLELSTTFLSHEAIDIFTGFSGVNHLIIKQPEKSTLLAAPKAKRERSIQCATNLLLGCHNSLHHLEMPGEFCSLESLTLPTTRFPVLQTFILRGYPPLDAGEFPVWRALHSMPRLSNLGIFCRLRVTGAVVHRFALMPQDASPPPGGVSLFPSQLETLTISHPSLEDRIFKRLPPSLRILFLDFTPDWENMLSSKDMLSYHEPTRMLRLLQAMQKVFEPSGMTCLEELHIKMGWCVTPEMLECISRVFPSLRMLELQGVRYFDRAAEAVSNMVRFPSICSLPHVSSEHATTSHDRMV